MGSSAPTAVLTTALALIAGAVACRAPRLAGTYVDAAPATPTLAPDGVAPLDGALEAPSRPEVGPRASAGCGAAGAAFAGAHEVAVAGKTRKFLVRLPDGYEPARPYPLVFGLHGAGGDGPSFATYFPLVEPWKGDAIFVFPSALFYEVDGRTTWRHPTEENLAFFDAMVETIATNLCVDRTRVFASGFSSGGFFSNTLGCRRGDVVRAIVPVAGGDRDFDDLCVGHPAVMVISSPLDTSDPTGGPPGISHHERGLRARDYFRARNGCAEATDPVSPAGCVQYRGCRPGAEVRYCEHGQGHAWPVELHAAASAFLAGYE